MSKRREVTIMNPPVEEKEETLIGIVSDCKRLNIRREPNVNKEVVFVVDVGAVLVIDLEKSTDEFYKIYTETGVEGYCMKRFVDIKYGCL